ncbi:MAG: L-threonylcarbamoyladenylate synthase [Acidimicrobiia bacterium]
MSVLAADDPKAVVAAREALERGLPVGLPTETVYVVAVDPFSAGASDRLFRLLHRRRDRDLTLLVANSDQVTAFTTALTPAARRLMERCWPGPLTLVLPVDPESRADLGDDDLTVGVRMTAHPATAALCREFGPLGVATATLGDVSLVTADALASALGDAVPVVVDAGPCRGPSSTVIDATGEEPHLIREGALPWSEATAAMGG